MTLASAPPRQSGTEPVGPAHAPRHSPSATVARGALLLLSAQPVTWAASALGAIVTPRYLGAEALGAFTLSWTIAGIAGTFVTLGVPEYLVRRVANRPAAANTDAGGALVALIGVSLLAAVALAIVVPLLGYPSSQVPLLLVTLCGMVFSVVQAGLLAVLRAQERHARFAWLGASGVVVSNCLSVAVLMAGGGATAYAAMIVLSMAVTTTLVWWVAGLRPRRQAFDPRLLREVISGGLPFLGWNVALRLRMEMDRILLGILSSVAVIGWYSAAYRIIGVTVFIPTLITTPLLPALSRHADDRPVFDQTLRRSIIAALVLTTPLCAMIVGFAPAIPATLHWPASFNHSVPLIMILALQMPLVAVDMVIGTGLIALHRERPWLAVATIGAAFNVAANLVLILVFEWSTGNGAIGAAVSTVATELVILGGALILLPAGVIDRSVVSTAVRIFLVGVCVAGAVLITLDISVIVAGAAAGGVFLIAAFAVRLVRPADVRSTRAYVSGLLTRRLAG